MKRRRWTRLSLVLFALLLLAGTGMTAKAADKVTGKVYVDAYQNAKGNWQSTKKKRVAVYSLTSFKVDYGYGDSISKLKANKKGLDLRVTRSYERHDDENRYGYSTVTMMAQKAGTYKVSFDVVDSQKKKKGHYTMTVLATAGTTDAISKVTFGKQTVFSYTGAIKKGTYTTTEVNAMKVSGTADRLKVTPNSQYKVTGVLVVSVGANGKYAYKKVKNGGTVTLSKDYESVSRYADGDYSHSTRKYTYVYVSYKDKFLGDSLTYSVTNKRGRKEIKTIRKNGKTGEKSVSYSKIPTATVTLWQY
ncbi:MAG: hypothetical protein NC300_08810 [Bacteroidales bacterium]|nr:hypothetical protein [Clostridium sp.]MCM1204229.1 hypothetical protein [Bacteroidales bacterium]